MENAKRQYPGVYALDGGGVEQLVHLYQGGLYKLADVREIFDLGILEETADEAETVIILDRRELGHLKADADAYSFDYAEPFIEMCLEMHRFALEVPGETVRFTANFVGEWE